MTPEQFQARLAETDPEDDLALDVLVGEYSAASSESAAAAVLHAQAAEAPFSPRALSVVTQLEEAAVHAILASIGGDAPAPGWMLLEAARGVMATEHTVAGRFRAMLRDGRRIQPAVSEKAEEKIPAFRVCDEAYLALRRILNVESPLQYDMESRHYLELPDSRKDREIGQFEAAGTFTRFLPDVDREE
jgi:hypothetical protein